MLTFQNRQVEGRYSSIPFGLQRVFLATERAGSMATTFDVGSQTALNNAIDTIEQQATDGSNYEIDFTGDITEGDSGQPGGIYAIDLPNGVSLTINGNGYALNGAGVDGGLAVMNLNSAFGLRDEGVGAEFSRLSCVTWAQALAGGESGGR